MRLVSKLTGLSGHVLRIWERRYGAVAPRRTLTNRRLYTDADLTKLRLLARATRAGHKIGIIARWAEADLRRLIQSLPEGSDDLSGVRQNGSDAPVARPSASRSEAGLARIPAHDEAAVEVLITEAMEAITALDPDGLRRRLDQGAVRFGTNGVLHKFLCPLARKIGALWSRGEITAAQEHFASALLRDFVSRLARPFTRFEGAPRAIVATPAGQLHELGALMVSCAAANIGWEVVYLGACLPAAEIAGAAAQKQATAVLLSIVYPSNDHQLPGELRELRRLLPRQTVLIAGGPAAADYAEVLRELDVLMPASIPELVSVLETTRLSSVR